MAGNSLINIPEDPSDPIELKKVITRIVEELNKAVGTNAEALSIKGLSDRIDSLSKSSTPAIVTKAPESNPCFGYATADETARTVALAAATYASIGTAPGLVVTPNAGFASIELEADLLGGWIYRGGKPRLLKFNWEMSAIRATGAGLAYFKYRLMVNGATVATRTIESTLEEFYSMVNIGIQHQVEPGDTVELAVSQAAAVDFTFKSLLAEVFDVGTVYE